MLLQLLPTSFLLACFIKHLLISILLYRCVHCNTACIKILLVASKAINKEVLSF